MSESIRTPNQLFLHLTSSPSNSRTFTTRCFRKDRSFEIVSIKICRSLSFTRREKSGRIEKNISGADEISADRGINVSRFVALPNKNIACAAIMRLSARNARVISVGSRSSRGGGGDRYEFANRFRVSLTLESVARFRFRNGVSRKFFPSPRLISRRSVEELSRVGNLSSDFKFLFQNSYDIFKD